MALVPAVWLGVVGMMNFVHRERLDQPSLAADLPRSAGPSLRSSPASIIKRYRTGVVSASRRQADELVCGAPPNTSSLPSGSR